MKVIIVIIIAAGIVWYFGFYSKDAFFQDYSGKSGYFIGHGLCADKLPKNPYQEGSDESQGFLWSRSNQQNPCTVGSWGFQAGCREYQRQLSIYQACSQN